MRIRIAELMGVVAVIAFATVSLKRPDETFEFLFFNFALIMIFVSLVMAVGRSNEARAFWAGFFVASSLYLGFAQIPDIYQYSPRLDSPEFTTRLLRAAGRKLHPNIFSPDPVGFFSTQDSPESLFVDPFKDPLPESEATSQDTEESFTPELSLIVGRKQTLIPFDDPLAFMRIGHAAWALLLGWIAGHASRFVYVRSRPDQPSTGKA